MFSVPGWNVSAPIAAQVEQPKAQDPNKLGKKAQKRKRGQEEQVNTEDLGKLWEKAEGQKGEAPKTEKPKAEGLKKEGLEKSDLPARALERAAQDEAAAAAEEEKKSKKRKRGPRKNAATKEAAAAKVAEAGAAAEGDAAPAGPKAADPESKRSKKRQKKEHKAEKAGKAEKGETPASRPVETPAHTPALMDPVALIPEPAGLTPLQKSMRSKLASARFRHLNESLYTKPSADSLSLFTQDPSMFEDYHRGFAQQVQVWPQNPVDDYVQSILKRGSIKIAKDPWRAQMREQKKKGPAVAAANTSDTEADRPIIPRGNNKPLPRTHGGKCLIADLGCGVASLAYRLQPHLSSLHMSIQSFDLSQPSGPSKSLVTIADISSLPLDENSTDIAIFCLALMGTNWLDFIDEAYRILRWKGELWIAEIKSRFGRVDKKKKIPINSIGSLHKASSQPGAKKKASAAAKKPKHDDVEGIDDSADEAELAHAVDGATGPEGTDVSAFISVLRARGFVLDALPERPADAVDLSNKMFVKLQFVKAAQPTKGKNAGSEGTSQGAKGSFKTSSALKMGIKGKKFTAVKAEEEEAGKEGEVLKPCLYKIR